MMHMVFRAIYYITDVAKYPGSCHDSFIERESAMAMYRFLIF